VELNPDHKGEQGNIDETTKYCRIKIKCLKNENCIGIPETRRRKLSLKIKI
jgi:hypothetical protein